MGKPEICALRHQIIQSLILFITADPVWRKNGYVSYFSLFKFTAALDINENV